MGKEPTATARARRPAWARVLAKAYEIDIFCCPRREGGMSVIAVIRDAMSIRKIIACFESHERGPL
jgi:2-phospho-L-lactate guanylyltransferase (CobY/MobA/RfbA family)